MSRRRNLAKVKKKLVLELADLSEETLSRIDDTECLISHGYRLFKCCFKCSKPYSKAI